jgi:hypothetical protein
MPKKEETINLDSGLNVSSIQITINLGQPTSKPETRLVVPEPGGDAPSGTLIRQVLPDPGDNTKKKVRVTFVPDDSGQNVSSNTKDPDEGDKSQWFKLLGRPANVDIDAGLTLVRFYQTDGIATWIPDDSLGNAINHVFDQETPHEAGGVSVGDFVGCWNDNGGSAGAAVGCLDRL